MDVMSVISYWSTKALSKIVRHLIKRKWGYDVDIAISEVKVNILDDRAKLHLNLDAELSKEELNKLLKTLGC